MNIFAVALLTLLGTQAFADKTLHVSGVPANELYLAITNMGAKPIQGVIEIGGTNCATTRAVQRDDSGAKWEYVTWFMCTIEPTTSYYNGKPLTGALAQALITALNKAGVHSYRSHNYADSYIDSFFVQSVSCEKGEGEEDEGDLMPPPTPALYVCHVEI